MQDTTHKLQAIDAKLKRWQSRLTRAHNAIVKLNRQRKRITNPKLMAKFDAHVAKHPNDVGILADALLDKGSKLVTDIPVSELPIPDVLPEDGLNIPTFLQRGVKRASPLTPEAITVAVEQHEKKKARAAARTAARASVKKAKLTGATRKMPLSDKAAMDFIKQA